MTFIQRRINVDETFFPIFWSILHDLVRDWTHNLRRML